jgi:Mrp family chromosome partitioning ATPase/capsular polysaccharide biosynthesis protein
MDQQDRQVERQKTGEASIFAIIRIALYKRMKALAALPVLVALCTAAVVLSLPKRYEATATIQIDPRQKSKTEASAGPGPGSQLESIEAELGAVQSPPVIRSVIDSLHLGDDPEFQSDWPAGWLSRMLGAAAKTDAEAALLKRLSVIRLRNTLLVGIRISSTDPVKSARIANAVAVAYLKDWSAGKSSVEAAATILGQRLKDDLDGDGIITESERVFASFLAQSGQSSEVPGPSIVAAAVPPRAATASSPLRAAATAFAFTFIAAAGLALLLEIKTSARTSHVESAFACPHMISLPAIPAHSAAPARACRFVLAEPDGPYAGAVRQTCRELEKRRGNSPSRLTLVVSALPGEGAECLASNIAHQYAMAGHAPLLVDADLRMASLTQQLARQSPSGLLDQMANRKPVTGVILRDCGTGLHFLPACGPAFIPVPVRDILKSNAFAESITALKQDFVTIVMTAPPLLSAGDAQILAGLADDIVFVTAWQKTPKRRARRALGLIAAHREKIVGAALTDIANREDFAIMSLYEVLDEMRAVAAMPSIRRHVA